MGKKPPTIILRPQPTLTLKPSLVVDEDRFSEGKPGPDPLKLPGQPVDEPRESKWAQAETRRRLCEAYPPDGNVGGTPTLTVLQKISLKDRWSPSWDTVHRTLGRPK